MAQMGEIRDRLISLAASGRVEVIRTLRIAVFETERHVVSYRSPFSGANPKDFGGQNGLDVWERDSKGKLNKVFSLLWSRQDEFDVLANKPGDWMRNLLGVTQ